MSEYNYQNAQGPYSCMQYNRRTFVEYIVEFLESQWISYYLSLCFSYVLRNNQQNATNIEYMIIFTQWVMYIPLRPII